MDLGSLKKVPAATAREICAGMAVAESLGALLDQHPEPRALLDRLVSTGHDLDAVRFLVCCLPAREAVWLACLAARNAAGRTSPGEKEALALDAAEKWVYQPGEETRRAAHAASSEAESGTPESLAALAAFYSGGSIGPENGPDAPPPAGMAARLVDGAVILACNDDDPVRSAAGTRRLLEQAVDVAGGGTGRRPDTPA